MSQTRRYWGVVPAAGVGRRMGGTMPKQYLSLNEKMVIEHSLGRLLDHPLIAQVYVALSDEDHWWDGCCYAGHASIVRVEGGDERSHSVLNALRQIVQRADPEDWVLVHDAARPCLRGTDIDRLINALSGHPVGGILANRLSDTVKLEEQPGLVDRTLPRENLWRALTPQMFRLGLLYESLIAALEGGISVTDEASAVEYYGLNPKLVEGFADNIKITHPRDLALAEFFLQQQNCGTET
ncbi:MAG: 2-C-methyl-D-erythritol 4-phosphate cytidylyltransferase [Gammaproteobacteria bacterium]|nr:2-C-methyl-D-erythritol 4-phosphate cytidylyltransferase [Gammaproteobacteria bacterium]